MERFKINKECDFYIDSSIKTKYVDYIVHKYNPKHNSYDYHSKREKLKLGVQLCDFLNTDFRSFESAKEFINKYSIATIAEFSRIDIYQYYEDIEEYNEMLKEAVKNSCNQLEKYKKAFIEDIKYIFNLNDLEELNELTPAQRLHALRESKKICKVLKFYDPDNLKMNLNNYTSRGRFSEDEYAQEVSKYSSEANLAPYSFTCTNIIQSFIIELFEMTVIDNLEIKTCKNCGKFFVPDNRADEIYCSNIYENGKTCKEVGHFRTQQKLIRENDDLRIYRNVYQKLLLRTRRNPTNGQYEKEFLQFKEKNNELKDKVNSGEITQAEYMEWLNQQ